MRKKRALLLFGTLTALLLSYVAWCARPFYLSVPPPQIMEIPEVYRKDAASAVVQSGLTSPDPFDFGILLKLLARPYDCSPGSIHVGVNPFDEVVVIRDRHSPRAEDPDVFFYPSGYTWKVSAIDFDPVKVRPERELTPSPP